MLTRFRAVRARTASGSVPSPTFCGFLPHGSIPALPTVLPRKISSVGRDYLRRLVFPGVPSWTASFIAPDERNSCETSEPFANPSATSNVPERKSPPQSSDREDESPPASAEASSSLGWIVGELSVLPQMFFQMSRDKAVRKVRKARCKMFAEALDSIRTLGDLYQVAQDLVNSIFTPGNDESLRLRVESVIFMARKHPEVISFMWDAGAVDGILRILMHTDSPSLQTECRLALSLMGYALPVKGKGIRILSLDGGGTRGVIIVEILKAIEREVGKSTHEIFDYIAGVSTGAIVAAFLGAMRRNVDECEAMYKKLCKELFSDPGWFGTGRLVMTHSLYDWEVWEALIKEHTDGITFEDLAANPDCPKVALISAVVRNCTASTYIFRNYALAPGLKSAFAGNSGLKHNLWEAVRASSAAPGIFKEVVLDGDVHFDGGLTCNNPTAVAIHECRRLWPGKPIQAVVSIGNGIWKDCVLPASPSALSEDATPSAEACRHCNSVWDKLTVFFNSATSTEQVHVTLQDLLPREIYFRLNPYMSENVALDESDLSKLEKLQEETRAYLHRNRVVLDRLVEALSDDRELPVTSKLDWNPALT